MYYLIPSRSLLQGVMAGALVLAGAGACSRPDQSESGSNTAAIGQDTTLAGATTTTSRDTAANTDTLTAAGTSTGGAAGDTAPARLQSDVPRAATAPPLAERSDTSIQSDTTAAGYRAMESDTAGLPNASDSARVTEDTSEISQQSADTASVETVGAAGYAEMARDTSSTADQIDTAAAGVTADDGAIQTATDTTLTADTISTEMAGAAQADTVSTEVAAAQDTAPHAADTVTTAYADTATGYADTAVATADTGATTQAGVDTADTEAGVTADGGVAAEVAVADTSDNAGRIRPPEDSTEILGRVTADTTTVVADADTISNRVRPPEDSTELRGHVDVAETADEEPVDPAEQEISEDREVAGAAALETNVTGVEAVALMTRQGARCSIVDPESDEEVRWDMSSTPVTLNPCGLGSMVLSRIWVER